MKLAILDRDGVINHTRDNHVRSANDWQPIDGSIEAIARLGNAGYTVVVATNQPGLARGSFDLDDLEAMHAKLTELVEDAGGQLAAIFYCPHGPDDQCKCRKPMPGLIDAIEAEFNVSAQDAILVGDSLRDLQAGQTKGCRLCLVLTGNGEQTLTELSGEAEGARRLNDSPVDVFADLKAVVDSLLA
ncbi:D-glycero-beta-D-manno-heptose 1,7-bisphosphate 7-phosphatase [Gilvimarinus agarilyticus]|uniref:D-glycero-beta-D-manno-heptose 1,7-bisphosphate 7-phosphatase n=1 Tax=unclassified Gilvimarinus TaxID=2642066 RepID=UPI001C08FE32|nr:MULTISPECIES: D-glycero-beta-D-manno-heptose 1,7-bisphosphate 7-phosphatase [unclassified Gilvimarinus]MBU2884230.1 D-glycero-beta-D-manno-heptose 1,7-bisphosphate 7-phosphatase [Gilvimarinus agarilyticus]MDO6569369.1 D-glycero-beta-D-manno-heptose 1,7-bisphosphate 7-phosphatase [Gilvimarinus sp. 2_MG-2023]MDO6747523.1 D-glycero-beta-D-manno-heptose 1,7-bisphosphate 7-phosphatase [Gilvimarinus sp. 1_MG-2023]